MSGAVYHQECLRCAACNTDLNKQQPYQVDGNLMCKPCAETDEFPVCKQCGKLVKSGACAVDAHGNSYHEECYAEKTKPDQPTCERCLKAIKSGSIIHDIDLGTNNAIEQRIRANLKDVHLFANTLLR